MKVSDLLAALQKVQQVAGDVDVVLKDVDQGVETALLSLGVHISASTGDTSGAVVFEHGHAQLPPPAEPEPSPPPA